jgi:coenzyme F420-reducing hydrogenase delta subunit/Fe-S-cluster-containing hydrogenase component 2
VKCSGRVDLKHILLAFANGVDGMFVGGCHINDCHYNPEGNYDAMSMVNLCKKLLEHIGINPKRLRLEWVSAGEGIRFANIMNEFAREIEDLGPLGKSEGRETAELNARIEKIAKLVPYIKLEKMKKLALHDINEDYTKLYTSEEIDTLVREAPSYWIDPDKCQACMTCARRCPADAIISAKNQVHVIDQDKCIRCGTCLTACPPKFGAVTKIVGEPVPPPLPEEKRAIVRKGKEGAGESSPVAG